MLNPQFNFRAPQNLITPNGTAGWQTVGTLMNGAAGLMTYLDAKKRAEKMNKAQDDYYEMLKSYLENKQSNNTPAQAATPAPVQTSEPVKSDFDVAIDDAMNELRMNQNAADNMRFNTGGQDAADAYAHAVAKAKEKIAMQEAYNKAFGG